MHVSSHIRPFLPDMTPTPRQPSKALSSPDFSEFEPIAGFPENRRDNLARRFSRNPRSEANEDELFSGEDAAQRVEAVDTFSTTLKILESSRRFDLGAPANPADAAFMPSAAARMAPQTPSFDDLIIQALAPSVNNLRE